MAVKRATGWLIRGHYLLPLSWRKGLESVLAGSAVFAGRLGYEGLLGPYETTTTTAKGTSKNNRFNEQNNNSARISRFFVHFFAFTAQLRREMAKF